MVFLCIVLLVTRIGGVHLHLCFDGSEPPASVHVLDGGIHHNEPAGEEGHQDRDIAPAENLALKLPKMGLDLLPVLFFLVMLWGMLPSRQHPLRNDSILFSRRLARDLLPPLRGPPLPTV